MNLFNQEETNNEIPETFTFVDLFAGIGGFHLAMHDLGGKCVFASEWDEKARQTYEENFRTISPTLFQSEESQYKLFAGDITKVNVKDIPNHDLLCAGFPCQPFSQAGHKKGFDDTRGTLFFNIAEIIKEKQPKAVFLENVRGLLKHDQGKTFKIIRKVINELGYSFHYKVVKASEYNLPQLRPRLFMICFRKDINDLSFEFPNPVPLEMTMSDVFDGKKVNRDIGFTLRVGGRLSPITDRRNWDGYIVNGEETRITPKEGKRMQGFPENFIFPVSDNIAIKQLGNSVAVKAVKAVGQNVVNTLYENKGV